MVIRVRPVWSINSVSLELEFSGLNVTVQNKRIEGDIAVSGRQSVLRIEQPSIKGTILSLF